MSEKFVPEYVFCADFSLRKPGFAVLHLAENGRMRVVTTSICDNSAKKVKGGHGEVLVRTANHMQAIVDQLPRDSNIVFVRERGFSRFAQETQALYKVVGVADYMLQNHFKRMKFNIDPPAWVEIAPKSIKLLVAGSGKATKDEVQEALKDHVGVYDYPSTDESDAVAAGVAYLIENNFGRPLRQTAKMPSRMPVGDGKPQQIEAKKRRGKKGEV